MGEVRKEMPNEDNMLLKALLDDQRALSIKLDEGLNRLYARIEGIEANFNKCLNDIAQQMVLRKDCEGCKKSYIRRDVALALIFGVALATKADISVLAKLLGGG